MNKLVKVFPIIAIILLFLIAGCSRMGSIKGSEDIKKIVYDYNGFNSIGISNAFDVEIIQSNEYKLVIICNNNIKKYLTISNNNKILKIGLKKHQNYSNANLKAIIHTPNLEKIEAQGASNIYVSKLNTNDLTINLSGASDLSGEMNVANDLQINASGSSEINIKGNSKNAKVNLKGATNFNGKNMTVAEDLSLDCSGVSNITLTINGKITATLAGASSFNYYGNGTITNQTVKGSSSIKKI